MAEFVSRWFRQVTFGMQVAMASCESNTGLSERLLLLVAPPARCGKSQ